jgi:hypothetical protein
MGAIRGFAIWVDPSYSSLRAFSSGREIASVEISLSPQTKSGCGEREWVQYGEQDALPALNYRIKRYEQRCGNVEASVCRMIEIAEKQREQLK